MRTLPHLLRHLTPYVDFYPCGSYLDLARSIEVLEASLDPLGHGLLSLTYPDTGVVVLLVWLVLAIGVANLRLEVVLLGLDEVADTAEVGPLHIGVQVDLHDTI
jgi:hypothetical protein